MQPIALCAYEVDAEPVFDSMSPTQRMDEGMTDDALRCPRWKEEMCRGDLRATSRRHRHWRID